MGTGLGKLQREILDRLQIVRCPELPDLWHPLRFKPPAFLSELVVTDAVRQDQDQLNRLTWATSLRWLDGWEVKFDDVGRSIGMIDQRDQNQSRASSVNRAARSLRDDGHIDQRRGYVRLVADDDDVRRGREMRERFAYAAVRGSVIEMHFRGPNPECLRRRWCTLADHIALQRELEALEPTIAAIATIDPDERYTDVDDYGLGGIGQAM